MQLAHEVAASRYLHGNDNGLSFHNSTSFPYATTMSTWDVGTYDTYAWYAGAEAFDKWSFDPAIGYDKTQGGDERYPNETNYLDEYFVGAYPAIGTVFLSAAQPATDSASAGTAMATGRKTEDGNIAWLPGDPADGELPTIAQWVREQGGAMGVVSTVQFNHATPACFVSHNVNRNNYSNSKHNATYAGMNIAEEIVTVVKPDVVIGAGDSGTSYMPQALRDTLEDDPEYTYTERTGSGNGSALLESARLLALSEGNKLFGVFGGSAGYFEHPVPADATGAPAFLTTTNANPTLAESTTTAVEVLKQRGGEHGFFVMVEGGDIDWANHANDYSWMIGAMHNFTTSVQAAIDMVENDADMSWDNTLLIVTSDHSNSYMRLVTGKELGQGELPTQQAFSGECPAGQYCGAYVYPDGEVVYGTGGHTNELVTLAAKGAGAELFEDLDDKYGATGVVDNTDIYFAMKQAVVDKGAKHVLLFIGDGMNIAHEVAYSRYMTGEDDRLPWSRSIAGDDAFDFFGYAATWDVTTYNRLALSQHAPPFDEDGFSYRVGYSVQQGGASPGYQVARLEEGNASYYLSSLEGYPWGAEFTSPATDSASAGTAFATGQKTDSGNLAWESGDPDHGALKSIVELVRQQKRGKVGVVSTVPFSHATPAAFVAHNASRNNYTAIGDEIIFGTRPDVVIGAGHPSSVGKYKYLSKPGYGFLSRTSEYVFVERDTDTAADADEALLLAADEAASAGKKLFGLFGNSDGNFESPVPANAPGAPAVERGSLADPTLAAASEAALRVLSTSDEGFFLMVEQGDIDWANHDNDYARMVGTVYDLDEAVKAIVAFVEQEGDDVSWDNTMVIVTSDHGNSYLRFSEAVTLGAGDLPEQLEDEGSSCLESATYCGAYVYPGAEVSYGTGDHTNELVSVYAAGAGTELLEQYEDLWYPGSRIIDNTHLFHAMVAFLGLERQ
jgi:alkaline phosphatase